MGSQLKASMLASTLGALLSCRAAVNYVRTKFFVVIILSFLSCRLAVKEGGEIAVLRVFRPSFQLYLDRRNSLSCLPPDSPSVFNIELPSKSPGACRVVYPGGCWSLESSCSEDNKSHYLYVLDFYA